jgi:hypothetical protein
MRVGRPVVRVLLLFGPLQEKTSMAFASCQEVAGWNFAGRNLVDIQACSRMPCRGDDELRRMTEALDRLFFDRCIGGLKSMPLMTRLLLASPHPHDAHSRPFGPLQEKTSMDRYLVYVKRFLCYCLNVLSLEEEALFADHGFRFTHAQRASLEQLWAYPRFRSTTPTTLFDPE